jgi:hypothetical protein
MELTRNESADLVKKILADMLESAPGGMVDDVRETSAEAYINDALCEESVQALYQNHQIWLAAGLDDEESLDLMDKLVARLRYVGELALIKAGQENAPWRD